jgi:hypothetical protein
LTVLKAVLNHAFREGLVPSDDAWRLGTPFREADSARVRYLTDAESQRLVAAADEEFRPLILAAQHTEARYEGGPHWCGRILILIPKLFLRGFRSPESLAISFRPRRGRPFQ